MKSRVPVGLVRHMSSIIRSTVGEDTRVFFEEDGIHIRSVDFYGTCKLDYHLDSEEGMLKYLLEDSDSGGINWDNIDTYTKKICESESILFHMGDYDIDLGGETSKYHSVTVAETSLENDDEDPNIPEPDYYVDVATNDLYTFLKSVESVSKEFRVLVHKNNIIFEGFGSDKHNTEIEYTVDGDYELDDIEQTSKYLVGKVLRFMKSAKSDALEIGIYEGSNKPIVFRSEGDKYSYTVLFANVAE